MVIRFLLIALSINSLLYSETRIEKNVIYGMYSGLALLMDVHHAAKPNGHGLILIQGSGWNTSQTYDAQPLTVLTSSIRFFVPTLLNAGYTLFVVNHRSGPRFHYPAAVDDVQRAVRYIRYNAKQYGIDPDRIGAIGYSSGAYLAVMLGVLDGRGDPHDPDPVNRVGAKVQCVVGSATPTDLQVEGGLGEPAVASFMGQLRPRASPADPRPDAVAVRAYREASPVTHVSSSSAPILLLHGDADQMVPFHQAEIMEAAMRTAGADVTLIRLPGGGHGFAAETGRHPEWPDVFRESVQWLQRHL